MKTYLKTLIRTFKKHITRFISIICMVLVSVGFIAGLGSAVDKINYSLSDYYADNIVSDFILKDASGKGFNSDDGDKIKSLFAVKETNVGMSVDVNLTVGEGESKSVQLTRLYFLDFENQSVNVLDSTEGEKPEENADITHVYADGADNKILGYEIGTEIELDFKDILTQLAEQNGEEPNSMLSLIPDSMMKKTVTVSGTVQSPLTFAKDGEPSYTNPPDTQTPKTIDEVNSLITLENILFISKDIIPSFMDTSVLPLGDMYVAIENRTLFNAFSQNYKTFVEENSAKIVSEFGTYDVLDDDGVTVKETKNRVEVLTLNDNYSFVSLYEYGQKVMYITIVLMVAFLFVTALVVLSTMTRLMDEERSQIACLRTLGYSSAKINFKYVLFALIATCLGGGLAYLLGWGLANLLYFVFNYSFVMPPASPHAAVAFYFITIAVIVVTTLVATVISGIKMANETPANLLRPKPPKAGKKVILEKIPLIWNRLSFKYKSTVRNVLRYKSRFFMTVIAVAVSTGLVVAGLALLEVCLNGLFASYSIMIIAIVVVAFAGLLTVVVIYTLTNINVSERNRELATLMVLGYHDKEVAGYIYREIYIDTVVGIIFGYPAGYLMKWIVFKIMGVASTMVWSAWVFAPVIVLLFTAFVTLILRRKIVKIDMNECLKAIE